MANKLTFQMIMSHSQHLFDAVKAVAPPGYDMSHVAQRWAFLVTIEELADVVDEMMSIPEFAAAVTQQEADDIKTGKAALFLPNGMSVIPELVQKLDG